MNDYLEAKSKQSWNTGLYPCVHIVWDLSVDFNLSTHFFSVFSQHGIFRNLFWILSCLLTSVTCRAGPGTLLQLTAALERVKYMLVHSTTQCNLINPYQKVHAPKIIIMNDCACCICKHIIKTPGPLVVNHGVYLHLFPCISLALHVQQPPYNIGRTCPSYLPSKCNCGHIRDISLKMLPLVKGRIKRNHSINMITGVPLF